MQGQGQIKREEVMKKIGKLKNGKAAGEDGSGCDEDWRRNYDRTNVEDSVI